MKIYIWVSHLHLKELKNLVNCIHQTTKFPIMVYSNDPKKHERHFQVEIEYNTYINLLDNKYIQLNTIN